MEPPDPHGGIDEAVDAIVVDLSGDARFDPEMRLLIP
jgi:hypothetical protein